MAWVRCHTWICLFCLGATPALAAEPEKPAPPVTEAATHFNDVLAPLLANRCLGCHNASDKKGGLDLSSRNAALAGGQFGPVLVPGNLAESLLWEKIRSGEMPPKKGLPANEQLLIKKWIASGAAWGNERIDPLRYTTANRAGYDWWSLRPVQRPPLPALVNTTGCENSVDYFIRAQLAAKNIEPAPPASRETLIRRVTYDLTGLPPMPEEVAAFVAETSPQAYSQLVQRLLASPQYGVRWARHWLDLARFGESNGFEYDQLRENAWPYRDWVVNALNADLPYDEFARLQLAGDVLAPRDPAALAATGFLVAGPFDGLVPAGEVMKQIMRQDVMEDFVGTLSQTFLGLTAHCARCHDHKFDPISQRDYYQLSAALSGVTHGEREAPRADIPSLQEELTAAQQALARLEQPARTQILAARKAGTVAQPTGPAPLARWEFKDRLADTAGALHAETKGAARLEGGALVVDGKDAYAVTVPLAKDLVEKTLEVWVRLPNLDQAGGGAISVQTLDGATFDAIVFGEREPRRWMAGSNGYVRTQSFQGPAENEADARPVHLAITYAANGDITGYRNGQPYGQPYHSSGPVKFTAGNAQVVFGLRHAPAGGNRLLHAFIERAQLHDRALSPAEVAASAGVASDYIGPAEIRAQLAPEFAREHERLASRLQTLNNVKSAPAGSKIYAVVPRAPEPTFVLSRGNPLARKEEVAPGGIAALANPVAPFTLEKTATDAQRRQKLAAWIASPQNPLFSRVLVNRLWHYHFGVGLVNTPNDFGFSGGRPSHPELLDWLASEFVSSGFSLKHLHYLLVTSATYQQASTLPAARQAAAQKVDAENRLLWRKTPLRLEAECARDAALAVSGELNGALGGKGFHDFKTYEHKGTRFYDPLDPASTTGERRSLYRTWARGGRSPFLDTLDCPDPSANTPSRAVTTTPLQALALMNNSFMLRQCDRFAARVAREAGPSVPEQITRAYALAFQRAPQPTEQARLQDFVAKFGLPALCRVLFNSNEFVYVE